MISIRNMQIYDRVLSKFEKIINNKLKYWKSLFYSGLLFQQNSGQLLKKMQININKLVEHHHKILENHTFQTILLFANERKKNLKFYSNFSQIISAKKQYYSRILMVRLKLKFFLSKQITIFSEKVDYFIALSRQRALYKQAIKVLSENSRFKDYVPIKKKVLFESKRTIIAFIYYNPLKMELLIISDDSDINDYKEIISNDEKLTQITDDFLKDQKKEPALKKYLDYFTTNLTLIKENSKSFEKTFKIYCPKFLDSAMMIQKYTLKQLYYRIFEIYDKEYEYKCKVYVHFSTQNSFSRIVLQLKTLPSFVKSICDFPDNCLNYLEIADKMNHLENFIERYVSFNERKKEFVFIPPSTNKWIIKKKKQILIQGNEKISFELGAEIDYLNNKISIRLLKDENKFYKILIPESYSLEQKKKFISDALDSVSFYFNFIRK